ncbi:MAG TPA: hypothetical protein VLW55_26830 [Burkholderiaceae bacterium]|nr:hypothetical protein [Burkholderiaceae bacterium]
MPRPDTSGNEALDRFGVARNDPPVRQAALAGWLQYTMAGPRVWMSLLVHHDAEAREYACGRQSTEEELNPGFLIWDNWENEKLAQNQAGYRPPAVASSSTRSRMPKQKNWSGSS